ncbi:FAR-17a/AIG1-like protein family-containing protein [Strongyloides ratti]|uniref:FAR-17a/AIG1-like protein family-containing protein n=1 Tax=Strongyloides ratti TaxID=34506 RepID=A0A090LPF3_STRRB|nr:FAR-17a/AIG1-like protein family-containing protein [Strongyloides ratti]CEF70074.1 FAR-17a/AIG1-like protein family-containing protein [Strongyloides ratti]
MLTIHSYVNLFSILTSKIKFLTTFRDILFHTIIFPVAILTSLMFWGLYIINPELVMPSWAYQQIPGWINHVTHTYPFITVILEIILTKHEIPSSMKKATLLTLTAFTGYILILVHFYLTYNVWLYPIFHYISTITTISILMSTAVLMVILSNIAIYISKTIHSSSFSLSSSTKYKKNI